MQDVQMFEDVPPSSASYNETTMVLAKEPRKISPQRIDKLRG